MGKQLGCGSLYIHSFCHEVSCFAPPHAVAVFAFCLTTVPQHWGMPAIHRKSWNSYSSIILSSLHVGFLRCLSKDEKLAHHLPEKQNLQAHHQDGSSQPLLQLHVAICVPVSEKMHTHGIWIFWKVSLRCKHLAFFSSFVLLPYNQVKFKLINSQPSWTLKTSVIF